MVTVVSLSSRASLRKAGMGLRRSACANADFSRVDVVMRNKLLTASNDGGRLMACGVARRWHDGKGHGTNSPARLLRQHRRKGDSTHSGGGAVSQPVSSCPRWRVKGESREGHAD